MITEYMPLFVTLIGIFGAIGVYAYQRAADRLFALVEIRRAAYRNYLNAFMAMTNSPERQDDISRHYNNSEIELLVVGSDGVIQAVGNLSRFYSETNHDRFNRDVLEIRRLVAEVCRAMREDCFEKTDLSINEIQALVPLA